jgi:hypothetical protein
VCLHHELRLATRVGRDTLADLKLICKGLLTFVALSDLVRGVGSNRIVIVAPVRWEFQLAVIYRIWNSSEVRETEDLANRVGFRPI